MELVTGYYGVVHVTAAQDADLHRGFGGDKCRLNVGSKMEVEASGASTVTVMDGVTVAYGREFHIEYGDSSLVPIASNAVGTYRNDLVCLRYEKDIETGIESGSLEVIQGAAGSAGADPAVADIDIRTGPAVSQIPLARVKLSGASISGVDMLIAEVSTLADLDAQLETLQEKIDSINTDINNLNTQFGSYLKLAGGTMSGRLNIEANVQPHIQLTNNGTSGYTGLLLKSWSGRQVSMQVGTGGENRGVYDNSEDRWLVYADSDGNPHLGSSTIGSYTQPIYLKNGIPTVAKKYGFTDIGDGWYEMGGWVFCNGISGVAVNTLKTVPQGYRPYKSEGFAAVVRPTSGSQYYLGAIVVGTGGALTIYYYPTYGGGPTNITGSGDYNIWGDIIFCANMS